MSVAHNAVTASYDTRNDASHHCLAWIGVFCFCIAFALTVCGVFLYGGTHHGFFRFIARVLPLPAAIVDGRTIWYSEISERANALERLSGVDESQAISRARVLAERHAIVKNLADELHVATTATEESRIKVLRMDFAALHDTAHWTLRDVDRYAVHAFLLNERVEIAALSSARLQQVARAKIENIALKLAQGIGFADLATEYSEGNAVYEGGDIGYVDPSTLPEDLQKTAHALAVGEVSGIVETAYGFWLVKAEDVIVGDDGTRSVRLRVIEIKKDLLGDIVDEELRRARMLEFVR